MLEHVKGVSKIYFIWLTGTPNLITLYETLIS